MSRATFVTRLARQLSRIKVERAQPLSCSYNAMLYSTISRQKNEEPMEFVNNRNVNHSTSQNQIKGIGIVPGCQIGENVPRKDKISFLVSTLMDLQDSKEVVYSALDAWVAWERDFPIGALKNVLLALEKEQQWHRVIQVIKWMLSKGQGTTNGTYGQLIHALDMDHRVEEAQEIWKKKLAFDLHSVPWKLCNLMISVYYRNKMLEELVTLFKGLESFDRKPQEKSIVKKVSDAYELLGLPEEKERILEKYKDLLAKSSNKKTNKINHNRSPKKGRPSQKR
ncbi:PPR containing-like protein [Perilla frutescens var. hirtella]|uniref:PPR containing-like protein n=1 Tax=Perilla frutescens var. hirtella TaxID=608512 RepID=A0AAD4IU24_PERFH|nr:PPR containing-like protein [Perilla frutescens var. hirtella]KAH6816368.1 PPR containing-like protein [Perilla frutescens var. frutescens]KAH6821555.1 PPR containing-like protein [Perilla frutescens var. hirtella]